MNQSQKRTAALLIILILLVTGGYILHKNIRTSGGLKENPAPAVKAVEEKLQPVPAAVNEKKSVASNTAMFKSNDEIKLRYGKIEEVYLYNGKKYEGAVLTTDEVYTIVTIDGTIKIPMNEVKLRNIIR